MSTKNAPAEPSEGTETKEAVAHNPSALADFDGLERLAESVVDTVVFDDAAGSVKLIVRNLRGENVAFVAAPDAMIRACKPWRIMLAGNFAAAQPNHPKILDFTEDDYDSMKILMHIIHLQFPRVPTSLSITGLYSMAILTDRYFATSLVSPWILRWVKAVKDTKYDKFAPVWLWISWEYGFLVDFNRASRTVAMDFTWHDHEHLLAEDYFPPGVSDTIMAMRSNAIRLLLDPIYEYLERLLLAADGGCEADGLKPTENSSNMEKLCLNLSKDCCRLQAGCLVAGLRSLGLWPRKGDVSEITKSPRALADALLGIKVSHCYSNDFPTSKPNNGFGSNAGLILFAPLKCGLFCDITDLIRDIRDNDHLETNEKHQYYMKRQRRMWDGSL